MNDLDMTSVEPREPAGLKRCSLLVASLLAAGLGGAVLLLDLWVLAAVWAANYRRWPAHGGSEPAHRWLWLGVLPATAALLICGGYALHKLSRRLGSPRPKAPAGSTEEMRARSK